MLADLQLCMLLINTTRSALGPLRGRSIMRVTAGMIKAGRATWAPQAGQTTTMSAALVEGGRSPGSADDLHHAQHRASALV
jgi:hypothetical protein